MPKHPLRLLPALLLVVGVVLPGEARGAEQKIGLGLHYWKAIDDLVGEALPGVEDDGVSLMGSYLINIEGPLKFDLQLEYFRKGFGGSTSAAFAPQFYVLVGGNIYGGIGIGVTLASSFHNNISSPYFLGRVGWELALLPHLSLDLNLNYMADAFNKLDNFQSSALTVGAIVRWRIKSKD